MVNLKQRSTDAEIMDDFSLPDTEVVPVLKGLEKMNALFGGHKMLIKALKSLSIKSGDKVSDWGCGGGDALRAIAKWATKQNIQLKLTGVDATASAVEFARQEAEPYPNIDFILTDVLSDDTIPLSRGGAVYSAAAGVCLPNGEGHTPPPLSRGESHMANASFERSQLHSNQFDVVFSSLFTHHFADEEWIVLVKKMVDSSKKAVIITDLHRHWLLYYAIIFIAYTFTKSKMARFDGPLSVKRSFKKHELVNLLQQSGLTNYKIEWKWAFRWQVIIYKS
ncbi:MAG: methyltransferase domain-containing protein [Mucilaginibacter sp.]|uniref:methyltransferase domain-containing protein n=1 Tax=Mucilaginibacter sp. TaxID=1882438 RepID=UPI003265CE20